MEDREAISSLEPFKDTSLLMFLGLYLLLLAFFIMLNSISSYEIEKSRAVIKGLGIAFSQGSGKENATSQSGVILGNTRSLEAVRRIFEAAIPLAEIEQPVAGRILSVSLPMDALFVPGSTALKSDQDGLLEQLAASLGAPPPGMRFDMEFVVGVEGGAAKDTALPLPVLRAGLFARALRQRGAPADGMSIGVDTARDKVRLRFHLVPENERHLDFSDIDPLGEPE